MITNISVTCYLNSSQPRIATKEKFCIANLYSKNASSASQMRLWLIQCLFSYHMCRYWFDSLLIANWRTAGSYVFIMQVILFPEQLWQIALFCSCNMITFWETIRLAGMMLHNSLLCKYWLRLDSLTILSPVCKYCLRFYLISHVTFPFSISGGNKNKLCPSIHFLFLSSEWISLLERFLPRQVAITRAKRDWELDIISRYQLMVFI